MSRYHQNRLLNLLTLEGTSSELQNLPSSDGGTERLFCVFKGIIRVLQSCTSEMLTYEHGCSAWRRYRQGSVYSHNLVGAHVIILL